MKHPRSLLVHAASCGLALAIAAAAGQTWAADARSESNSVGMHLVLIPAGEYHRGMTDEYQLRLQHHKTMEMSLELNERPAHWVRISQSFWLATREVTVGDFRKFVDATGHKTDAERNGQGALAFNPQATDGVSQFKLAADCTWQNPGFPQTDEHPVVGVSWKDALAYCKWLSDKEKATYRLPTEAEWEYAARAGADTIYIGGNSPDTIYEYGNIADAALEAAHPGLVKRQRTDRLRPGDGDGFVYTAPVGKLKPNRWGLYDMHGNVWEWCSDRYYDRYYESLLKSAKERVAGLKGSGAKRALSFDPQGPETTPQHKFGDWRSMRGGCWCTGPMASRCASRAFGEAGDAFCYAGFRVVKVAATTVAQTTVAQTTVAPTTVAATESLLSEPAEESAWQTIAARFSRPPKTKEENGKLIEIEVAGLKADPKQGGWARVRVDPADGRVVGFAADGAAFTNDEFALFASFRRLRQLTLWHNFHWHDGKLPDAPYSGRGLSLLTDLPDLEGVTMAGGGLSDAGLEAAAGLKSLKSLDIWHDRYTDAGIAALRKHPTLETIRMGPQFAKTTTDKSLEHLATCPRLKLIKLGEAYLTYEHGLRHLAARRDTLTELDLDCSLVAPDDLERIRQELPKTEIKHLGQKKIGEFLRANEYFLKQIKPRVPPPLLNQYLRAAENP